MIKARRKSDIRDVMERNTAALQTTAHLRPARRKRVPKWQTGFLIALAQGTSASDAARSVGISFSNIYAVRSQHPEFAAAWAKAISDFEQSIFWFKRPVTDPFCICKVHKHAVRNRTAPNPTTPNPTTVQRQNPTVQR
jgi:hypothetical protein